MFVIDRIEGNIVVVEYNNLYINVPMEYFNEEVREGDILNFIVDKERTNKKKEENRSRLENLFKRDVN